MISPKTKYLFYKLGMCFSCPAVVYALLLAVHEELISGVLRAKNSTYYINADFWYFSFGVLAQVVFIVFFTIGACVAWSGLLKGRREAVASKFAVINIFRSNYMIRRTWFALPIAVVLIAGIYLHDYIKN